MTDVATIKIDCGEFGLTLCDWDAIKMDAEAAYLKGAKDVVIELFNFKPKHTPYTDTELRSLVARGEARAKERQQEKVS